MEEVTAVGKGIESGAGREEVEKKGGARRERRRRNLDGLGSVKRPPVTSLGEF